MSHASPVRRYVVPWKDEEGPNRKVNWIMTQCAHAAVMHDNRMKAYCERLKKRNRPSVAITHVANNLSVSIFSTC